MAKNKWITINVPELVKTVGKQRKLLIQCALVTAVVAIVFAFSVPRIYKSSVVLAPESSSTNGLSNFSSLADMVGVNLDLASGTDALYPEIYPDLLESNGFLVSLFDCKVKSLKGDINTTYYQYMKDMQEVSWFVYPFKLVGAMLNRLLAPADVTGKKGGKPDPFMLSKEQDDVAKAISKNIKCSVDKKTSVITIEVTAQDPLIAATMTEEVRKLLQESITNYRTNKARTDMNYIKALYDDAFKEYEQARKVYARFSDSYQNLSLPSYQIKKEVLENEMSLKFSNYRQLSEQLQLTQAKVLERTPAFTIVKMANVPVKHSNMSILVILVLFEILSLGGFLALICYRNRKEVFTFAWQG